MEAWNVYDVDYVNDETLYWAFSTNYTDDKKWDNINSNYYAFAGTDFMLNLGSQKFKIADSILVNMVSED